MKVDIIISSEDIKESKLENKTAAVIDMYRATSVIITALKNKCRCVIPYLTVEEALKCAENFKRDEYILGGERKAVKIEGFDCANSPLEYTEEKVKDKTIIMTTTNGTKTLTRSKKADRVLIAALLNAKAVAEKICEINKDAVIINAGTNGNFSMDDFICAGYIIKHITELKKSAELSDIAKTALIIYESHQDILSYVKEARHYSVMKSLNLDADIEYCIQKDITEIVPEYKNGIIKCIQK